jgi:prepilin-type N-terminal cleavage/methylation domain-containing protein
MSVIRWPRDGSLPRRRVEASKSAESGFTLVELLVTMVILPFIVGALAFAIVAVFQLNGPTLSRINDAADAQVLSTPYENDIHGAAEVTSMSTVACGPTTAGTQLLATESGPIPSATPGGPTAYSTVISYVLETTPNASTDQLVRVVCTNGNTTTPTSSTVVSADMSPTAMAPTASPAPVSITLTPASVNPTCANTPSASGSWVTAECVTGVSFSAVEPASVLSYKLVGVPLASASSGQAATLTSSSACGFATPGSGTYASSLCFVDFSSLSPTQDSSTVATANCPNGGQYVSAAIDYTPFAMQFCILVTAVSPTATSYSGLNGQKGCTTITPTVTNPDPYGAVCPSYTPTYYNPPNSEAYLGNNGFYTGIPGDAAIYQTQSPSTTDLWLYNISVKNASNASATGWELVTGDAETTDPSESITWSTCASTPTATVPTFPVAGCSGLPFSLLPDNPGGTQADDIGNACGYSGENSLFNNTWLTGLGTNGVLNGTNTVECAASDSTAKTGTVMLEASTPSNLSVRMVGTGLEAVFVGLLLQ